MKRLTATLAIVIGLLIGGFATASAFGATTPSRTAAPATASPVNVTTWTGNGSENLPCTGGTLHWIFTGGNQGSYADLYINGVKVDEGNQAGPTPGRGAWHFLTTSDGVTTSTPVEVRYDGVRGGVLTISHCINGSTTSTTTSTIPTSTTDTIPTTSTTSSVLPSTSTTTIPTTSTTNTAPSTTTTSTSTVPSTSSTTTQPVTSTLPSESTRPSQAVPTAVDAGISGPTGGGGQPPMMSFVGIVSGLAMAAAGAFALLRRRGQHEA